MKFFERNRWCFLLVIVVFILPRTSFSQLNLFPTITNATCPDSSNGSISLTVTGGTAPYTYLWTPGGKTISSVTGLVSGTYSLSVTDNAGNSSTASYVVGPAPFEDGANIKEPVCTMNGEIILVTSGGTGALTYQWSTGATTQFITEAGPGSYSVLIADANGCTKRYSYVLAQEKCFVEPAKYFTPNDDGINDTWVIVNSQYFNNIHLIVFDRWGTRVFEKRGTYEPWDGKSYLGLPVPDAVYYYFFYQDKEDKQKDAIKGSVTIVR